MAPPPLIPRVHEKDILSTVTVLMVSISLVDGHSNSSAKVSHRNFTFTICGDGNEMTRPM